MLIDAGIDVDISVGESLCFALRSAVNFRQAGIVKVAMSASFESRSLLCVMEALLDGGADINARDVEGNTALHGAAYKAYADVVQVTLASVCFTCLTRRLTASRGVRRR